MAKKLGLSAERQGFAACGASELGSSVTVFEKIAEQVKLLITGKGR